MGRVTRWAALPLPLPLTLILTLTAHRSPLTFHPHPNQAEGSGVEVEYGSKALGRDVALSYALTVHKSQGSEYPVVVLPVLPPTVT